MQPSAPAREPLRVGHLLWGIFLLLAAPAFAIWMAVVGLLSALAAANITVDAVGTVAPLVSAGQGLLAAFAFWATFVSAGAGLVVLILLGVRSLQAARRPVIATGPTFGSVLWGWALAIPFATGIGALVGSVLDPVAESIGTDLSLDAGPGTGINYEDAVYGLITGGAWLFAALVGLVLAVILTVRHVRARRRNGAKKRRATPR
ncbi:hypothetical protein C5B85_05870 [Pseudoclavibacter sp. AY1F1]|uniref:hypothetical protein n=1 Tax=Pseudoclavibacter sp. AY1F1 TaxID=2080583 RepID=UPI000CE76DB1|nr:hypothetical protein [Pseudoclavibacter sp. AY1F1]PPF46158.1 hypothetical protein C5B85_05870 [Pseudoclavibacter sp. AY1F1]